MTDTGPEPSGEQRRELRAVRNGLQRAGLHFVRAAYEVVAGVGAFIDELASVRRSGNQRDPDDRGLTRIELEE